MARDDSGETVLPGKGGKPAKPMPAGKPPRGFPFRLLLWAILMTASTGALGYYAWRYRDVGLERKGELATCAAERVKLESERTGINDSLATCQTDLGTTKTSLAERDAQLDQAAAKLGATKDELVAAAKVAEEAKKATEEAKKRFEKIAEIQKQFAKMIDTGQLKVKARRGNLVVELPAEVLFPSGSADLSEKGELAVLEVGFILKHKDFADRRFLVVGHTDNLALKGSKYADNLELSTARALTVTRQLAKAGMLPENLIPAGAGEHDPATDNSSKEGRQRNRRIEIALLPALSELPPLPSSLDEKPEKEK